MDAAGPALPWAAAVPEGGAVEASQAETEFFERGMTLEAAGLTQGSRIEVCVYIISALPGFVGEFSGLPISTVQLTLPYPGLLQGQMAR